MSNFTLSSFLKVLLLFVNCFVVCSVTAQTHTPRTVNINTKCAGYYEYLPINYATTPTQKYPLIVYIHGGASYGNGTAAQLNYLTMYEGTPRYIKEGTFPTTFTVNGQTTSFIVISPQFKSLATPNEIKQVIDYAVANYRVDLSRIYLTGYSVGGGMTWNSFTNFTAANRLAAIAPVAPYISPYVDTMAKHIAAANLPVWAIHSNSDQVTSVNVSINLVNKVNSFNPLIPAIITRLTNVPHDTTVLVSYNPTFRPNGKSMYEWFLGYRRIYPPVANAGNDVNITLPANSLTLNGTGSTDPEAGALSYSWSKVSGPSSLTMNNTSLASPPISNLIAGTYKFRLEVTDVDALKSADTVQVRVINPNPIQPPVAVAGNDVTIVLPQSSTTLNGSSSSDADGIIEKYAWSKIAGPSQFTIGTAANVSSSVSNLKAGVYKFKLTVTDNEDATGNDTVQVTVVNPFPNILPTADAGPDQGIRLPVNSVTLDGSGSGDVDGDVSGYLWRQINGPTLSTISGPTNIITTANNLVAGFYQFELSVMDDSSGISRDTITISVNPALKYVKVNLYGGSNPAGAGWNNWNVSSLSFTGIKYSDNSASSIATAFSANNGVGDNGTGYPTTMCPVEVGRYASIGTALRTLTISGLDNNKRYDFEGYASRLSYSTISTKFTIGSTSISILTDRNYANKAAFSAVAPASGRIVVSIDRVGGSSYFNGFTLTEIGNAETTNAFPIAVVNSNQVITLPQSLVTLSAAGSSDPNGTIVSYNWQKLSGPAASITSPNAASTTVTGLDKGVYIFQLRVTDNGGAIATNIVKVTVNSLVYVYEAPVIKDSLNCGSPVKIVVLGASTTSGNGASPIDSSWVNKLRKYVKQKNPASEVVNLADSGLNTYQVLCETGFVPPSNRPVPDINRNITRALLETPDIIILSLSGDDAIAGYSLQEQKDNYERTLTLANSLNIPVWVTTPQGISDVNGSIIAQQTALRDWINQRFGEKSVDFWTTVAATDGTIAELYKVSGDNINPNNYGHDVFYKRVVAEKLLDTICLRNNLIPVANAGASIVIDLPVDSTQLNGSSSNDPDGSIVKYKWSKILGPASYNIVDSTAAGTKVKALLAGDYEFELQVTDNFGAIDKDTVQVHVNPLPPQPPVAHAGTDIITSLPADSARLDGTSSFDPDGIIASYVWRKVIGPDAFEISDTTSSNPLVSGLTEGQYIFELLVTDTAGMTAIDSVNVTVNPVPNQLPIANAGIDSLLNYPFNSLQLDGSGSYDTDGSIQAYNWTRYSGPLTFNIENPESINPNISGLAPGTHIFVLTVTDDEGATDTDSVIIIVSPPPNQPPIAAAGNDVYMTLPVNSTPVNGSGSSDIDGTILSYKWTRVSGPATFTISNSNLINPVISNLLKGVYVFELAVTDNSLAVTKDSITITVFGLPNVLPVARAGSDQTITLPVNSVTLNGSASSDQGGVIVSYQWRQVPSATTPVITNATAATTTVTGFVAGTYLFELQVTDDSTTTAKDTVLITVNTAPPVVTQKVIQVNLFAGSNPAASPWNNWNVATSLSSGVLKYSDATNSTVTAVLSSNTGVGDNGTNYPTTMCPPTVGRYGSFSNVVRTLTISGLDDSKLYHFEGYASRLSYTTVSSRYTIGSTTVTIFTDRNYANKALFNNIAPVAGRIVVTMDKSDVYSYLNGFTLTENITQAAMSGGSTLLTNVQLDAANQYDQTQVAFKTFPNPFVQQLQLQVKNNNTGKMKVSIIAQDGKTIRQFQFMKDAGMFSTNLPLQDLPIGVYFVQVEIADFRKTHKIVKTIK